jgi:hypothetical protein
MPNCEPGLAAVSNGSAIHQSIQLIEAEIAMHKAMISELEIALAPLKRMVNPLSPQVRKHEGGHVVSNS